MIDILPEITGIQRRLEQHDERLRMVEQSLAVLPRIEEKIDKLVAADYGESLAILKEQAKSRDREIAALRDTAKELSAASEKTSEKFWKIAIVIALILGALQGLGVD